jgi:excisionase family DNA binding protein
MSEDPILYRVDAAAALLSVSRSKAYELIAKGVIPSIRLGATIRVPAAALRAMIEEQQQPQEGSDNREDAA